MMTRDVCMLMDEKVWIDGDKQCTRSPNEFRVPA